MEGTVTISVKDFEILRRCEKASKEVYKTLSKCKFVHVDDKQEAVNAEPVLEALKILSSI